MSNVQIMVLIGIAAFVIVGIFLGTRKKEDEYSPIPEMSDAMEEVKNFDQKKYTNSYLTKSIRSILIDTDWDSSVSDGIIYFRKSGEDKSALHLRVEYDFRDGKFNPKEMRLEIYSNQSYSYEYSIYGDKSDMSSDFLKFCYKKYFIWKTDKIRKEKEEVDKKLKSFNKVLGKSVDRDMKLDELLN